MARRTINNAQTDEIDELTGEVLPMRGNSLTTTAQNIEFGRDVPAGFSVAKYVSVPMLEVPIGQAVTCQLVDKVRILQPMEGYKSKFKGDHYASTIRAANGAVRLFTWSTVFRSEIEKVYGGDSYVGKWFQITRLPMKSGREGQQYAPYAITELNPPA